MEPLLSGSPQPGLPTLREQVSLSHREDIRPGSAHTDPSLLFTFGLEGLGGKSQCQESICLTKDSGSGGSIHPSWPNKHHGSEQGDA